MSTLFLLRSDLHRRVADASCYFLLLLSRSTSEYAQHNNEGACRLHPVSQKQPCFTTNSDVFCDEFASNVSKT